MISIYGLKIKKTLYRSGLELLRDSMRNMLTGGGILMAELMMAEKVIGLLPILGLGVAFFSVITPRGTFGPQQLS